MANANVISIMLAKRYLEAIGAREAMQLQLDTTFEAYQHAGFDDIEPGFQAAFNEGFKKIWDRLNIDDILDMAAPHIAARLSQDDMALAIRFYEGEAGRRIIKATPDIMADLGNEMRVYVEQILASIDPSDLQSN
jgi:hypothetical protein